MALGAKLLAGQQLGKYFDTVSGAAGRLASEGTKAVLKAGTGKFMPNVATKDLPAILRAGDRSLLPKAANAAAQLGVAGLGAFALDRAFDQQSQYSQPMSSGVGTADMQKFLMSQELQNQKFMHDMALVQARAESRIPGAQYPGSLQGLSGERAFEKSILDEVGVFGRGIYGTGLRA